MKQLMQGNEAVARGAWEAGCTVATAYPGTPSTEITELWRNSTGAISMRNGPLTKRLPWRLPPAPPSLAVGPWWR